MLFEREIARPLASQEEPWVLTVVGSRLNHPPYISVSHSVVSEPTLCDPMDCSPPGSSVHGILQARILKWVAVPFSKGSSRPRDWTQVSRICRLILYRLSHQASERLYFFPSDQAPLVTFSALWCWLNPLDCVSHSGERRGDIRALF